MALISKKIECDLCRAQVEINPGQDAVPGWGTLDIQLARHHIVNALMHKTFVHVCFQCQERVMRFFQLPEEWGPQKD